MPVLGNQIPIGWTGYKFYLLTNSTGMAVDANDLPDGCGVHCWSFDENNENQIWILQCINYNAGVWTLYNERTKREFAPISCPLLSRPPFIMTSHRMPEHGISQAKASLQRLKHRRQITWSSEMETVRTTQTLSATLEKTPTMSTDMIKSSTYTMSKVQEAQLVSRSRM